MSYGGRVEKVELSEVKLQAQVDSKVEVWMEAIYQARDIATPRESTLIGA